MPPAGIIVGLGNPGPKYERTRHNFGFLVADALLAAHQADAARVKSDSKGELWSFRPGPGHDPWLVLKPLTYMNLSGEAAAPAARYYRIEPGSMLVVHDELDLPLGRMKHKLGGGAAGHKGVASVAQCLGTPDFHRLRLGIGRPQAMDGASWVLSPFASDEAELLAETVDAARRCVEVFIQEGPEAAARLINGHSPSSDQAT